MARYKNVEFAKGLKCSFANFKKQFGNLIPEDEWEQAYKEVFGESVSKTSSKGKKTRSKSGTE